jgi:putative transposase
MKARYRYRIYPNTQQQRHLAQLFGCCRVVWNDALAHCQQLWSQGQAKPSSGTLQKQFITQAKQTEERQWLSEVSNIPLQQSLRDLDQAFSNFFKSCQGTRQGKQLNPPRFKKHHHQQSARFRVGGFKAHGNRVYLAKIGKIKTVFSRPLPSAPSSVTVIRDSADRYFLSFVVEIEPESVVPEAEGVGMDLGIKTFATLSTGEKVDAPKPLKKRLHRLRRLQRNLARKQKGSKRRYRARQRLAKLHAKIGDTRTDFLHKLSTRLIRENQTIAVEDLNVSGMVKNRKLARAISDLGWRQFRSLLAAKADKYGREVRVIDRWEPTSQRCSCCGFRGGKLDLSVRQWQCLQCGTVHDRDINAAINIKVAGGRSEAENGRGGGRKSTQSVAASDEASTHLEVKQLSLFAC